MTITLPPELERVVQESVESGRYSSVEELLQQAICLLLDKEQEEQDRMKLESLRQLVAEGIADIDAGRYVTVTKENFAEFVEGIKQRGRAKLEQMRNKHQVERGGN